MTVASFRRRAVAVLLAYVLVVQALLAGASGGAAAAGHARLGADAVILCSGAALVFGQEPSSPRSHDCPCGLACPVAATAAPVATVSAVAAPEGWRQAARPAAHPPARHAGGRRSPFTARAPPPGPALA